MTKKLQVGDEFFDYPITGDINYGEDASDWADAVTEALKTVQNPGDIPVTEAALVGTSDGTVTTGTIPGLSFDTAFVQRIFVEGLITREFVAAQTKVESFAVQGAYNGSDFNISVNYDGDDTDVTLDVTAGQFTFESVDDPNTTSITIKFKAKTIIDEDSL